MFRAEVKTKMHGFLNVLGAAVLAAEHNWDEKQTAAMLEDEDASSFSFSADSFAWENRKSQPPKSKRAENSSHHSAAAASTNRARICALSTIGEREHLARRFGVLPNRLWLFGAVSGKMPQTTCWKHASQSECIRHFLD